MNVSHHTILDSLLLFALVLLVAKASGWISLRLRQPAVLGELVGGIVLGPSLLRALDWPAFHEPVLGGTIALMANLGVIVLMFIAGLDTDLGEMRRVGTVAVVAGAAGVVAPLVLGALVALPFGYAAGEAIFIGIVLTATSVSITVQTLIELGQLETKVGTALLGAAVADDVMALIVLSVFLALSGSGGGMADVAWLIVRMAAYIALAVGAGLFLVERVLRRAHAAPVSEGLLAATLVVALAFAYGAEALGQVAAITGAYLAGVFIGRTEFKVLIGRRLHPLAYGLLVPVFFISIGLQTNARLLRPEDVPFSLVIIAVAVVGKIIGCGAGARLAGFTRGEAFRMGVGMISRGEVGLIIAGIGLANGVLSPALFAIMVIMVMASTLITPVLIRATYPKRAAGPAAEPAGGGEQ